MPHDTLTPANDASLVTPDHVELLCATGDVTILANAAAATTGADPADHVLPRFTMIAYSGDAMRIAGWRHPVVVDLDGMSIPSQTRPIRFAHSASSGVGHTDRITVEAGRLIATGVVSRDTDVAREIVVSGKRGFPWQASIGASVDQAELIRAGKFITVNGRSFEGPIYVARKTTLGEISFVDLGADMATSASIAARRHDSSLQHRSQLESIMTTTDTTATTVDPNATSSLAAGTEPVAPTTIAAQATPTSPAGGDADPPDTIAAIRAQALAETQRIAAIRRVCAGKAADIEAKAIGEGWTPEKCELVVLRASRPSVPQAAQLITHRHDGDATTHVLLEAACMLTAGLAKPEALYDEQTLDAAQKRFRGGIGLQELLLEAAWANGYTGRNFRDPRKVLQLAFHPEISAAGGLSTIDIGGILSNVANKFLLEGFFSVERVWRNISAVRNVSDFKTVTSYRLVGKDQYEQVAPGGELKHGTLGEQAYSNKADTYGLLLSIDRRDIINDDLGAITTVPRKLGRGSGLKINDVFWATFMNNAAFFAVGNKNYLAGADTTLNIDGLTKAEVAFLNQVDPDGKPLGIMPQLILVPTALSAIGTMLFKSVEIRDTTSSTKYPVGNPHAGKFRVEVSRYLSNNQYTGHSDKAWYLLADPNDLPVIEVAFLNGQESPTIETAEADFNVLGVQMRGYHDFGVALQEPRGGIKAKGEA